MKKLTLLIALLLVGLTASTFADTTLQGVLFNFSGTQSQTDFTGFNTSTFNATTRLGTLFFAYNPGPGSYYIDVFWDPGLNTPFFNEYGEAFGNGSINGVTSWEIGDSWASNIYSDTQNDALDSINHLGGNDSNYLGACVGANCNGDLAAALGFGNLSIPDASHYLLLGLSVTDKAPTNGQFYIQLTHPQDPNTQGDITYYLTGDVSLQETPTTVPEPASLMLLGTGLAAAGAALRRRLSK